MISFHLDRTGPPLATHVRIIRVPAGPAPEEVRRGWVGVEMPLHAPGVRRSNENGVLSHHRSQFARWLRSRLGLVEPRVGYFVAAGDAVDALEKKAPEAARWFRENVLEKQGRGVLLVFHVEECETVATE